MTPAAPVASSAASELPQLEAALGSALEAALPELIALRRHLHAHPELSGNEHQTAALVAGELRGLGWRVQEGVGRTGVLAELGPERDGAGTLRGNHAATDFPKFPYELLRPRLAEMLRQAPR